VAIVGGGISGMALAWQLVERRQTVAIVDRAGLGAGATAIQPGGVRRQWRNRANCLLAAESIGFYRELGTRLGVTVDAGFQACGYLFVAHTEEALASLAVGVAVQNELGVPSRLLTSAEASAIVPGLNGSAVVGASFCAEDGYFDRPQAVVGAFVEACSAAGVAVEQASVEAIEPCGERWSLALAGGSRLEAGQVVVAAGWETPALLEPLGVRLPIHREPRYLFYSDPIAKRLLEPLVVSPERHLAAKQLGDGSVLASDLSAGSDPAEGEDVWRRRLRAGLSELLPILDYVGLPTMVEGLYDLTPDGMAIVGAVPGHDGLWAHAGHSGRGFMMAPAMARLLADAIMDGAADELLQPLSPGRFDGAPLAAELQVV